MDNESDNRTIEDFVEDMVSDGRSLFQIQVVAVNTRWANKLEEIMNYSKKLFEKLGHV